ncbi:MAG: hypothetical protein HY951_07025 [Bacteroidia bacterium]|nr:hypothetical protein [Bacteroidia bacterium]
MKKGFNLLITAVTIFIINVSCDNNSASIESIPTNNNINHKDKLDSLLLLKDKIFLGFSYGISYTEYGLLCDYYEKENIFSEKEYYDNNRNIYTRTTFEIFLDTLPFHLEVIPNFDSINKLEYIKLIWSREISDDGKYENGLKCNYKVEYGKSLIKIYTNKYGQPKKSICKTLKTYHYIKEDPRATYNYNALIGNYSIRNLDYVKANWENDSLNIVIIDNENYFNGRFYIDKSFTTLIEEPGIFYYPQKYITNKQYEKYLNDSLKNESLKNGKINTMNNI